MNMQRHEWANLEQIPKISHQILQKYPWTYFWELKKIVEMQQCFIDYNDCAYLNFSTFQYAICDFIRGMNELKPYPELKEEAFGHPEIQWDN